MDVLFLTYIFRRGPAQTVQLEHQFGSVTITDWANVCREAITDYVLGSSQKIGGPYKTVEIDDSKSGRRKYNRGHKVERQWVFGGVERESGKHY